MIDRCCNKRNKAYRRYGGRGITVWPTWRRSFLAFLRDMGERPPGTTLERKKNDAGYSPDNCVWASRKVQNRNRRDNRKLTHNGRTELLVVWAEERGISSRTLYQRVFVYGWPVSRAITTPVGPESKGYRQLELDGRVQTLKGWAAEYGINSETLASRLKAGMELREALTKPNRYKHYSRRPAGRKSSATGARPTGRRKGDAVSG